MMLWGREPVHVPWIQSIALCAAQDHRNTMESEQLYLGGHRPAQAPWNKNHGTLKRQGLPKYYGNDPWLFERSPSTMTKPIVLWGVRLVQVP